jgi:saccharopine dehydrogenase-like NADP-dependent oxidoreductase
MDQPSGESRLNRPAIVVLGAAGQMASVTAMALIKSAPDYSLRLLDIDMPALEALFATHRSERVVLARVDLTAPTELRASMNGARLVIHGAGPFHKTAAPVRALCLELGIDYLDIDDDVESTLEAIALHDQAVTAGVALFVGHGASPGFTNMLALDLMRRLDEPRSVEVAWTVGDEGKTDLGRAVAEHTMHIGAGPCLAWREGGRVTHQSFADSQVFPMGQALGDYRLYEAAHPEPVTLPWSFPQLRSVSCWGGLHPQANNGLLKGLAMAQSGGRLTMDQACSFLQAVMRDELGGLQGWRAGLAGMVGQIRRGENDWRDLRSVLWNALRSVHGPTLSGMAARVTGRRGGDEYVLVRQCGARQPGRFLDTMATTTGLSTAAFVLMILDRAQPRQTGFLPPEKWADPERFFTLCAKLGGRPDQPVVGVLLESRHP